MRASSQRLPGQPAPERFSPLFTGPIRIPCAFVFIRDLMDRKNAVLQVVRGSGGATPRTEPDSKDHGPFEVRSSTSKAADAPNRKHHTAGGVHSYLQCEEGPLLEPPVRRYDCENYETCLDLAAVFNWSSFSCGKCCGQPDDKLKWRACQIQRKDSLARAVSDLPPLGQAVAKSEVGDSDTAEAEEDDELL
jgi:hypothetical protein